MGTSIYMYPLTKDTLTQFVVVILPFKESAMGMASYRQQFAKHLRQNRIFRTGAQKNISNKGALSGIISIGGDKVR
jgi:hypothetical protein